MTLLQKLLVILHVNTVEINFDIDKKLIFPQACMPIKFGDNKIN